MKTLWVFISVVLWTTRLLAFDVVVHTDPISWPNLSYWYCGTHCGMDNCNDTVGWEDPYDLQQHLDAIADKPTLLRWLKEMGVTILSVYYPDSNYHYLSDPDLDSLKFINMWLPEMAFRYEEAQHEDIPVLAPWVACWWQQYGTRDTTVNLIGNEPSTAADVLVVSGGEGPWDADTLWRTLWLEHTWDGWFRREATFEYDSIFMPMHFRVICDAQLGGCDTTLSWGKRVATLYWLVKHPGYVDERTVWLRYPACEIPIDSFLGPDAHPGAFDTLDFRISAHPDSSIMLPLDANWRGLQPTASTIYGHAYWNGFEANLSVQYEGCHTFYLYKIEVWDEAYHRLFNLPAAEQQAFNDSLAAAFEAQRAILPGQQIGYYTDENIVHRVEAFVGLNKILQTRSLPTFYVNGWAFRENHTGYGDELLEKAQEEGVNFRSYMMEMYMFPADSTCLPTHQGAAFIEMVYCDSSSDRDYYAWDETSGCPSYGGGELNCSHQKYNAASSLQAGLDRGVWGTDFFEPYSPYVTDTSQLGYFGLARQVQLAHDHGMKQWAMLLGGRDGDDFDNDSCFISQVYRKRNPTYNEIILECWLALTCNADGIMWYPWHSGGLLEIDSSNMDWCTPNGIHIIKTERYEAAKHVLHEIKRLAPIIESLEFVATYASRAFELDYPDSTYDATQLDVLATNTSWYGQPYRSLYDIGAWAPDTTEPSGWSDDPEPRPYVQVSRFRNPLVPLYDPNIEDYWFLIVNRRALRHESRKIRLVVEIDSTHEAYPYYVDHVLGDSTVLAGACPQRTPECAVRFIDVILQPGDAELVHFYRGEFGCDTTLAHIDSLTLYRYGQSSVRLLWEEITQTDEGDTFNVDSYFICGSMSEDGPYTPIGVTSDTTYVDSVFATLPRYYYNVQACGSEAR